MKLGFAWHIATIVYLVGLHLSCYNVASALLGGRNMWAAVHYILAYLFSTWLVDHVCNDITPNDDSRREEIADDKGNAV